MTSSSRRIGMNGCAVERWRFRFHSLVPIPLPTHGAAQATTVAELSGEWGQGNQPLGVPDSQRNPRGEIGRVDVPAAKLELSDRATPKIHVSKNPLRHYPNSAKKPAVQRS